MNQVATNPMLAEKIAATVIQPSTLVVRLFTRHWHRYRSPRGRHRTLP